MTDVAAYRGKSSLLLNIGEVASGVVFPSLSVPVTHRWLSDQNVIVTGSGVSSWIDIVTADDLVQATDARRPAVVANQFGTIDGIDFDGVDDDLRATGLAAQGQPWSICAMYRDWVDNLSTDYWFHTLTPTSSVLIVTGGDIRQEAPTTVFTGHSVAAGKHDLLSVFTGASSLSYLDALAGTTINSGANGRGTTFTVGAFDDAGNNAAEIIFAEIIILNGAANQADATALNQYRIDRYGA